MVCIRDLSIFSLGSTSLYINNLVFKEENIVLTLIIDIFRFVKSLWRANHKLSLVELKACEIESSALSWFKTYLSSLIQRLRIGDTVSKPNEVTICIPQGSVLGGLLFLVYINDLPRVSENLFMVLFADNTCISFTYYKYFTLIKHYVKCQIY